MQVTWTRIAPQQYRWSKFEIRRNESGAWQVLSNNKEWFQAERLADAKSRVESYVRTR